MTEQEYINLRIYRNRLRDKYEKASYREGRQFLKEIKEIDKKLSAYELNNKK